MKCVICKGEIDVQMGGWDEGHNAEPVKRGRCCSICNTTKVIPARMFGMFSQPKPVVNIKTGKPVTRAEVEARFKKGAK